MHADLFARALGVSQPWFVDGVDFDERERQLVVRIDFRRGSRFAHAAAGGAHPVHDTRIKRYRHLNFFQHECSARGASAPGADSMTAGSRW